MNVKRRNGASDVKFSYPGLYYVADRASSRQQALYLWIIRAEFFALFVTSILTIQIIPNHWYVVIYGIVLLVAGVLLGIRSFFKLEQNWYQARALAESVKTATWKYVMWAKPFDQKPCNENVRDDFRNFLREILTANRRIGSQFDGDDIWGNQITAEMESIRTLPRVDRLDFYMKFRVDNQGNWYATKAKSNRSQAIRFIAVLVGLYILAIAVLLMRVVRPEWSYCHPEPLILVATALIGWMQIKKYNELAASYNLTAIEIGILKSRAPEIKTDDQLSNFIDDAEEAFSREHTQWLARRSH